MLDRIDRAILRLLLRHKGIFLTTNSIATKTEIAPLTAKRHLDKLEKRGYIKGKSSGKTREYEKNERKNN